MSGIFTVGVVALFAAIAFLVFRKVLLWYWRINELLDTLKKIENHLSKTHQTI